MSTEVNNPAADTPIQDIVPTHCYGCGSLNKYGLHLKSYWDGQRMRGSWMPEQFHKAGPDILYGGTIASLIDCMCGVTTTAAIYGEEDRKIGSDPMPKSVTANLNVSYMKPTALNVPVELECWVDRIEGKKIFLECTVSSDGEVTSKGTALYIKLV